MRLLLITLDAVFARDAQALLALPSLGALARGGVFCSTLRTVYPTLTYPVHASILTGCYPDSHGVAHNQPFQPDTPENMRTWFWNAHAMKRKTLHQAAHERGMRVASFLWPVSGHERAVRWNFPEILPLPGENAALKMIRYGSSFWILADELRYGKRRQSIQQPDLDAYATFLCSQLIHKHAPDMITIHLTDCDSMRHAHGVASTEADAALARLDANVGILLTALDKHGLTEDTLVVVASDHGQEDISLHVPLDARICAAGIPARTQSLGMGAYIHCQPAQEDAVYRALSDNMEDFSISTVYDADALRAMRAPQSVRLAVEAAPGVAFSEGDHQSLATHGFSATRSSAQCLLWLKGPGVRANVRMEDASVVDIAPTIAYALGLSLPEADGRVLQEALIF